MPERSWKPKLAPGAETTAHKPLSHRRRRWESHDAIGDLWGDAAGWCRTRMFRHGGRSRLKGRSGLRLLRQEDGRLRLHNFCEQLCAFA